MRQVKAIALLIFYVTVNTELHQMLSLPVLFEHYEEHKQRNSNINIISFLVQHYSGENKTGEDQHHQQLPFKGNHCGEISTSIFLPGENLVASILHPVNRPEKATRYKSPFNSSSIHFTIWQPPRA
jgi:hypothetical protein